jgi:hypothetical protein
VSSRDAWALLAITARRTEGRRRLRTLVPALGSGFVTQAVSEGVERAGLASRPAPVDWLRLLTAIVESTGSPRAKEAIRQQVPGQNTLLWDAIAAELAATQDERAAHQHELAMRRRLARLLLEDRETYAASRRFVEAFLALRFGDVLSFNFDSVLLPEGARPRKLRRDAAGWASLAADAGATRVWYPHGHASLPQSIVLGAHAYGARLRAMQAAFEDHARRGAPRPTTRHDTFVAVALERPLLFIGLSLTREEWTLWWLLSQRARFLARRPERERPPVFVFVKRPGREDPIEAHAAYASLSRATGLLGLTLLEFGEYAEGWRQLRAAVGF